MYSYEERVRAVELYIKLGKRSAAARRQLGYPTKGALSLWYRQYMRSEDLPRSYTRSPTFTAEQKQAAVDYYATHDRCIAATLRALGYPCRTVLTAWIDELLPDARQRRVGKAIGPAKSNAVKQAAVIDLCTRHRSADAVAQQFSMSRSMLYHWKHQLLGREAPASMKRHHPSATVTELDELVQQRQSLLHDIQRLQLEHDILKKAAELLKKGQGITAQLLNNREKTMLVDALKSTYALPELLAAVKLARSSYFYHRARQLAADKYTDVRRTMADIFMSHMRCYGYRRIWAALRHQRVRLSEKVVRRLMRQEGLVAAVAKRRRYGSYLGEIGIAADNLIQRDFHASAPNEKWLTDLSEFQFPAGKVYLSPMIDCFDGLVVSWSIGMRPDAELVNTMLDTAIQSLANDQPRPIVHSDRGAHYRWPGWIALMQRAGLTRSMSRKGYSPDNAACEGFFGRLKVEWFYARDWRGVTIEQFMAALDAYIRWYNEKRIKLSLGALSPLQYRESLAITA